MAAPKERIATTIQVNGEEMEVAYAEYQGVTYTIRELSIDESDEIDDKVEGQKPEAASKMWMRLALETSIVDPPTTLAQIGKWTTRKYVTVVRAWNRLNVLPEENPTAPAGSAGPTSPSGGTPSPTP